MLTTIIFLPTALALLLLMLKGDRAIRMFALIGSLAVFFLSLGILGKFDASTHAIQMHDFGTWLPQFGINYYVGIDGISLWLVILTTFLTPITILGSWKTIDKKVKTFHASLLVLETAMLGTFLALDAVLFYMFWELMLIPMYLIIGVWGGEKRIYAAVKFFIYTMVGSVFMLVAIIALMYMTYDQLGQVSASILDFYKLTIPFSAETYLNPQTLMFLAFSLAFAIKVPMFPVHTWLPDAHVQAPTPGSVILAGVLLKMGTYGFVRFSLPLFPDAVVQFTPLFIGLAVFGIVYGALVAMIQPDIKKLVAYSSVSHLGYVVLGLFVLNSEGVTGGMYQMLNHGVSTGGLFLLVGMIYERTHSREIAKYGGLATMMPIFAVMFFLMTISSIAVPGTNGFVGEFLILLGTYQYSTVLAVIAVSGVIWGAAYMLWMYKRVFFGGPGELLKKVIPDLNLREISVLVPLVVLIFWMGIFPEQFLGKMRASVDYLVNNRAEYRLDIKEAAPTEEPQEIALIRSNDA